MKDKKKFWTPETERKVMDAISITIIVVVPPLYLFLLIYWAVAR